MPTSRKSDWGQATFRKIPTRACDRALEERRPLSSRLPDFLGATANAADLLTGSRVAVVGSGSVGQRLSEHVARLQPQQLWIVDPASFKAESLLTHAVMPDDLGKPKASYTGERCQAISPRTAVLVYEGWFQDLDPLQLASADLVMLASDNLAAEVAVTQWCMHFCKPLIQASVYGDALVAQVRQLSHEDATRPCLACAYGDREWQDYYRATQFSCDGGVAEQATARAATMSTSFLCSLVADLACLQLVRQRLSLGGSLDDTIVEYCGYTHATTQSQLVRSGDCACDHTVWERARAGRPLPQCSLREMARLADLDHTAAGGKLSFTVGGHWFVERGLCTGCRLQPLLRFVAQEGAAGRCQQCGGPLHAGRLFAKRGAPAAALGPRLGLPLAALGALTAKWVLVEAPGQAVLIHEETSA